MEERLTELELRYMQQSDLVEQLNTELVKSNETIDLLQKRVRRLERQVEEMTNSHEKPGNEKPPHY